jgi:hypothetical protein
MGKGPVLLEHEIARVQGGVDDLSHQFAVNRIDGRAEWEFLPWVGIGWGGSHWTSVLLVLCSTKRPEAALLASEMAPPDTWSRPGGIDVHAPLAEYTAAEKQRSRASQWSFLISFF